MTHNESTDWRAIQELAASLGIGEQYHVRVIGGRIEFHLRTRVLIHRLDTPQDQNSGQETLPEPSQMTRKELIQLAASLEIPLRSTMSKSQLVQAVTEQLF